MVGVDLRETMVKEEKDLASHLESIFQKAPPKEPAGKKELLELNQLIQSLPGKTPEAKREIEKQIARIKAGLAKNCEEWMEMVRKEENVSREIGKTKS